MESLKRHTDYGNEGLTEAQAGGDPFALLASWITAAEAADIFEPNAMVLSTVDADGAPSSRTVLLKGLEPSNIPGAGLEFVSNYLSHKGRALATHDRVSLVFPWYGLKRQVIVSGRAQRTDAITSDAFFDRRPHGARLAAIASDQSEPIASRDILDERMAALEEQYPEGEPIPRPEKWGAYRVIPDRFEFWAGRSNRFHDRIVFTRTGETSTDWVITRLQP
jgi:pyridoxamine 5'-phosphate oxidase